MELEEQPNAGLQWLAISVIGMTLVLLIVGALVTSNEAGDSVPDWPLSFGRWVIEGDQFVGNVRYEYSHRFIAGIVGIATFILAVWAWKSERRSWVRRLAVIAFIGVVAQAALGGVRVLLGEAYKPFIAVPHALVAQSFLGLLTAIAVFASRSWTERKVTAPDVGSPSLRSLSVITVGAILAQLVLGAGFRHRAFGIIPHILGAVAVTALVIWVTRLILRRHRGDEYLRKPALALCGLLAAQVVLGICAYLARLAAADDPQPLEPMVSLTVAHVFVGALTLITTVVLALRCHRALAPAHRERIPAASDLAASSQRAAV
ncbi:MAG TPA: COX15/CtaA family protein [Blastocatellia bacterium]|nr:COX15/CtaA family protein [Blastocatellia bacterium]